MLKKMYYKINNKGCFFLFYLNIYGYFNSNTGKYKAVSQTQFVQAVS